MDNNLKRIRDLLISTEAPLNHNVGWVDVSDITNPLLKVYINGDWSVLAGGGGSGYSGGNLKRLWYYGGSDTQIVLDSIASSVQAFTSTNKPSVSTHIGEIYYYVIVASNQTLVSVTNINMSEPLVSQFVFKGNTTIEGSSYKVYEFTLDGVSLDADVTIIITETTQ